MIRELRFHPDAVEEAARAAAWYEGERPGVGSEFLTALGAALDLISIAPVPSVTVRGKSARRDVRRIVLKRFPYDIVFIDMPEFAYIVAFAHHSRRPGYWRKRTRN